MTFLRIEIMSRKKKHIAQIASKYEISVLTSGGGIIILASGFVF